jgi:hypothetical protein
MKPILFTAAACAALAFIVPSAAQARPARCVVTAAGTTPWQGACDFQPERGGSFTISPPAGRSFTGGVSAISLYIVEPGVGDVRGLTRDGGNSRWGEARRSPRDRACWIGADFSVCVY